MPWLKKYFSVTGSICSIWRKKVGFEPYEARNNKFSRKYTTKILKFIHQKLNFLKLKNMSFPKVEFEEKYLFSATVKIMMTVIIQNCRKEVYL